MKEHLSAEELLEVRDGDGTPRARAHAASCATCAGEIRHLEETAHLLRSLPPLSPERDQWPEIRDELETEQRGWIPKAVVGTVLALAASVLLVVVLPGGNPLDDLAGSDLAGRSPAAPITDAEIDQLVRESQRLEGILRRAGSQERVTDGWQVQTVADLQDRIALIDAELAEENAERVSPARRARLWRVRVGLMNDLVQVRTVQPRYVEF